MSIATGNNAGNSAVSASVPATAGSAGPGGYLNVQKDTKESSTDPKFGEVLQKIQTQYGAKAEKPREIKKTLGKDDFLRIMITQMRNQDPTNPFKAEQMATQMAQFTSVEQMQNINSNLQKMATANQPLERLALTNLIGKSVTVDRDRFPHLEGMTEALSYTLPKGASEVTLSVISADTGETILQKDLGAQKPGEQVFSWDGKKVNALPAKAGNYMFRIDAKDERGAPIESNPLKQTQVVGVSFEGNEPVLLVGDHLHQERVAFKSVIKIDGETPAASPGGHGASPAAGAAAGAAPSAPSNEGKFFTFEKGVGSQTLDPGSEAAQELAKARAQAAEAMASAPSRETVVAATPQGTSSSANQRATAAAAAGQGFPNGLQEGGEGR